MRATGRVRWAGGLESDAGLVRLDPFAGEATPPDALVPLADLEALS